MNSEIVNLQNELENPAVLNLLDHSGYPPNIRHAQSLKILQTYKDNPEFQLIGYSKMKKLVGLIGVKLLDDRNAEIKHIVVSPTSRKEGIGSALINYTINYLKLDSLYAETDSEAVEFYKILNFRTSSLESRYKDTERFACILKV